MHTLEFAAAVAEDSCQWSLESANNHCRVDLQIAKAHGTAGYIDDNRCRQSLVFSIG